MIDSPGTSDVRLIGMDPLGAIESFGTGLL